MNPTPDTYAITGSLAWTASTSGIATGYGWQRYNGATLEQSGTVSGSTTTTAGDTTGLTSGTTYTYRLRSTTASSWTSAQVSTTLTPTACP